MPSRNKNPAASINKTNLATFKIDHPLSKLKSDFPNLIPKHMSEKEITRLQKWQADVELR